MKANLHVTKKNLFQWFSFAKKNFREKIERFILQKSQETKTHQNPSPVKKKENQRPKQQSANKKATQKRQKHDQTQRVPRTPSVGLHLMQGLDHMTHLLIEFHHLGRSGGLGGARLEAACSGCFFGEKKTVNTRTPKGAMLFGGFFLQKTKQKAWHLWVSWYLLKKKTYGSNKLCPLSLALKLEPLNLWKSKSQKYAQRDT